MRRYALLLTTMLFPASSHAATIHYDSFDIVAPYAEFMTIDATYSWPAFTSYGMVCCAYARSYEITQWVGDFATYTPIQKATFELRLSVGDPGPDFFNNPILPVIAHIGASSATFTLVEGVNHFSTVTGQLTSSLGGNMSLTTTFHTPIPAALPLFVAGLGMLGWFTRRRNPLSQN